MSDRHAGVSKGSALEPVLAYIDPRDLPDLPAHMVEAFSNMLVALSADGESALSIRASWIEDWWFTLIEGNGIAQFRNRAADYQAGYVLLAFALSGRGRPNSGSLGFWPRPGEMMLAQWEAPTNIVTSGEFRYLVAHIPRRILQEHADARGLPVPYGQVVSSFIGPGAVLYATIRSLASEAMRLPTHASLTPLLAEIPPLVIRAFGADAAMAGKENDDRLSRIVHYLETHLTDQKLSADHVARACGLSKRQLFRLFAESGEGLTDMLNAMRVTRARDLLILHPNVPIAEVARACGYSSPGYFSRVFRTIVGATPLSYRRHELGAA